MGHAGVLYAFMGLSDESSREWPLIMGKAMQVHYIFNLDFT